MANAPDYLLRLVAPNVRDANGNDVGRQPNVKIVGGAVTNDQLNDQIVINTGGGVGSAGTFVYPVDTKPPLSTSLTWVNQAGNVSGQTTAIDNPVSGFDLICPFEGDNLAVVHCLVTAAPTPPWTFTMGFLADGLAAGQANMRAGMVLRESATGKLLTPVYSTNESGATVVSSWNSATSMAAEEYLATITGHLFTKQQVSNNNPMVGPIWFRVINDGTNFKFQRSLSGTIFRSHIYSDADGRTPLTVPINNFFTTGPDQFGVAIGCTPEAAEGPAMRVFSWSVTTP